MNTIKRYICICCTLLLLTPLPGCAPARQRTGGNDKIDASGITFPKVTLECAAFSLEDTVRKVGEEVGGGLVLMNGLGEKAIPPFQLAHEDYIDLVSLLAQTAQCQYQETPYYYFVYPEGYEALLSLSLMEQCTEKYQQQNIALSFGNNTNLYNAFNVISRTLNITLVADNMLAENRCGELTLEETPLPIALEAILKSARVVPDAFSVACSDEYLFLYSGKNTPPESRLLNKSTMPPPMLSRLQRRSNLFIPTPPPADAQVSFYYKPVPLGKLTGQLSRQLDIPITCAAELEEFPVNPCVMNNVRLQTALDLLLAQWPVSTFGYTVTEDGIHICPSEEALKAEAEAKAKAEAEAKAKAEAEAKAKAEAEAKAKAEAEAKAKAEAEAARAKAEEEAAKAKAEAEAKAKAEAEAARAKAEAEAKAKAEAEAKAKAEAEAAKAKAEVEAKAKAEAEAAKAKAEAEAKAKAEAEAAKAKAEAEAKAKAEAEAKAKAEAEAKAKAEAEAKAKAEAEAKAKAEAEAAKAKAEAEAKAKAEAEAKAQAEAEAARAKAEAEAKAKAEAEAKAKAEAEAARAKAEAEAKAKAEAEAAKAKTNPKPERMQATAMAAMKANTAALKMTPPEPASPQSVKKMLGNTKALSPASQSQECATKKR